MSKKVDQKEEDRDNGFGKVKTSVIKGSSEKAEVDPALGKTTTSGDRSKDRYAHSELQGTGKSLIAIRVHILHLHDYLREESLEGFK